jgi:hypothetical protein
MAFTKGRDAEHMAESVEGHAALTSRAGVNNLQGLPTVGVS